MAGAEGEPPPSIVVRELLEPAAAALGLKLAAGAAGLDREVLLSRIQRPGLALTGFVEYIRYGRVQVMGGAEIGYLATLTSRERRRALRTLLRCRITCFVLTKGLPPPAELLEEAEARGTPVLLTAAASTPFIRQLSAFLEERLALRVHLHSVLLDVFGLGVLVVGPSGIGKSECGLELVDRGHRLVADDVVEVRRLSDALMGASPELTRYHMELRGLGVLNVKDLYGVSSIRSAKRLELVVSLEPWEAGREYDRLGLREERYPILGLEVPLVRMPVAPGRNIALLVEVAARNQLLKARGYDAARRFVTRVDEIVAPPPAAPEPARRSVARRSRPARGRRG